MFLAALVVSCCGAPSQVGPWAGVLWCMLSFQRVPRSIDPPYNSDRVARSLDGRSGRQHPQQKWKAQEMRQEVQEVQERDTWEVQEVQAPGPEEWAWEVEETPEDVDRRPRQVRKPDRQGRQSAGDSYGSPAEDGYGSPAEDEQEGRQATYKGGRQAGGGLGPGESLMPYRYGYAVADDEGNDFNQQEQSDGAQVARRKSLE